ncbi:MAG TPA: (2Fe-2S)-binding protein [Burkholderiales bacterium]|nr:(2Fe-2S)-binding protein [Burkholderiales bacterium]
MYVCICNAITERAVRECARNGACSVEQLTVELGVAAGCGRCRECADGVLREVHAPQPALSAAGA